MLHMFLVILKVIGFLLLVLLGILLLLVFCVLFWPVKYQVKGAYKDAWELKGTVTFLGIMFRLGVSYKEKLHWKLRIFGIPVLWDEKKRKRKKKRKKNTGKKHWDAAELEKNDFRETDPEQESISQIEEQADDAQKKVDNPEEEGRIAAFLNKIKRVVQTFFTKIKNIIQLFKTMVENIKKLPEKIKSVADRWSSFRGIFDDEQARLGLTKGKQEIILLLKRTKPKKIAGYVIFGFEDPATTGQVLGAIAVAESIWNPGIRVEPDFEKKVFATEFQIKGKLRGSWLLRIGWKVLYDKEIKYLTGQFKTLK